MTDNKMPVRKVLVCGAGVAGSVIAFWLAKHDFEVTVIERSRAEQKLGQGIEIEEPALSVVREMGILNKLKAVKTAEKGFRIEDQNRRSYGQFEVGGFSPTGALELMRGDLTEVLYHAADAFPNVTYFYNTTIKTITETSDGVTVESESRTSQTTRTSTFDIVIGADGARSRTRSLIFGPPEQIKCYKPVGAYVAYFSIPRVEQDWPYSRACHFPGRRFVWTRPTQPDSTVTSVYLIHVANSVPSIAAANASNDRQKQKEAFASLFSNLGWDVSRIISGMMTTDNFYSDELLQVKLPSWSKGRVALVGDAAWAPTPFTGEGNQLAIIGGWVLAQELARHRSPAPAFEAYERRFRSYVENAQQVPLRGYAPYLFVPETNWGIWAFRNVLWSASWLIKALAWFGGGSDTSKENQHEKFDLGIGNDGEIVVGAERNGLLNFRYA